MKGLKSLLVVLALTMAVYALAPTRTVVDGNYVVSEFTKLYGSTAPNLGNGAIGYVKPDSLVNVDTVIILNGWYPTPGVEYSIGYDTLSGTGAARDSAQIVLSLVSLDDSSRIITTATIDTFTSAKARAGGFMRLPIGENIFGLKYMVRVRQLAAKGTAYLPRFYLIGRKILVDRAYNY